MAQPGIRPEHLVLTVLHESDFITLDHLVDRLPQLSWSQVFQAVDALSRRGSILLRRRNYQYEVKASPTPACRCS